MRGLSPCPAAMLESMTEQAEVSHRCHVPRTTASPASCALQLLLPPTHMAPGQLSSASSPHSFTMGASSETACKGDLSMQWVR